MAIFRWEEIDKKNIEILGKDSDKEGGERTEQNCLYILKAEHENQNRTGKGENESNRNDVE